MVHGLNRWKDVMQEHYDDNQLHLPAELVRELKARDVSQPFVPASVDEAVLARARAQFAALAKADHQQGRGAVPGDATQAHAGPGAGGNPKAVFWGRTALAGVGSVAAALALAALLTTEPRSPEPDRVVAYMDRPPTQLEGVQRQLRSSNESAVAFDQTPAMPLEGGFAYADKERSDASLDDAMAMGRARDATGWGLDRASGFEMQAAEPGAAPAPSTTMANAEADADAAGAAAAARPADQTKMKDIAKAERRPSDAAVVAGQVMEQAGGKLDAEDLNQSGSLDILDVYLLARQREAGNKAVTQANIDALAARIVRLARLEGGSL